ncbi:DUF1289 domain-containing protein [Spiribacter pallidus]|uniref:DUF1289 domain-containing protein n=1 Tax=Spiribacter pallidus TaxID=1987936 RepID=UPI00349F44FB
MSGSSPCVSICEVESGRCIGCGRTEQEIAEWRDYPEEKRLAIMDRLEREAAEGGWLDDALFDSASPSDAAPAVRDATAGASAQATATGSATGSATSSVAGTASGSAISPGGRRAGP